MDALRTLQTQRCKPRLTQPCSCSRLDYILESELKILLRWQRSSQIWQSFVTRPISAHHIMKKLGISEHVKACRENPIV